MPVAVLASIKPRYCALISERMKTLEIRKKKPRLAPPFKVYIYCTAGRRGDGSYKEITILSDNGERHKGNGKVIGEFVCDYIANYEAELWDDNTFERIQEFYEPDDFDEYGEYEYKTIADNGDDFWIENMLCKSSCVSIKDLRKYLGTGITTFYGWHISDFVLYEEPKELGEFTRLCKTKFGYKPVKIALAPQSWCYVEE